MKSAGAIFPNRSPSNLPFVGRDHPLNPRAKRKREKRKGERNDERGNCDYKSKSKKIWSSRFSCDRVSLCLCFSFRDVSLCRWTVL